MKLYNAQAPNPWRVRAFRAEKGIDRAMVDLDLAGRETHTPEFAATRRWALAKKWARLDGELADGRPFVAGDTFSIADITGMMALKIADIVEEEVPAGLDNLKRWEASVRTRPSWNA